MNKIKDRAEERIEFEYDFCSNCPTVRDCKNIYQSSKCKLLYKALEKEGFFKKQKKAKENKEVVQFPVDMDEMQRNILANLLNARKECTEENLLTACGCVSIIDALFYLVKGMPVIYYDSENLKKYFGKIPEKVVNVKSIHEDEEFITELSKRIFPNKMSEKGREIALNDFHNGKDIVSIVNHLLYGEDACLL